MKALGYEIKAYKDGSNGNDPIMIGCGVGERGRSKAEKKAVELLATGEYEAVFVDAYNDEELVDEACTAFYKGGKQ